MFSFITKPIGCLFSLIGSIVVLTLVLVVAGLGLLSYFMPQIGAKAISEATGFPTSVGGSSFSFWKQRLELRDIRIDNPASYPEDDFLAIPSLSLSLDRKASDGDHLVLGEVALHIDSLTLVRLSAATLNGSALIRNLLQDPALSPAAETATPGGVALPRLPSALPTTPTEGSGTQTQTDAFPPEALLVRFEPVAPPTASGLPTLAPVPVTYDADGTPSHGERPRWLVRRLSIRIDNARLFTSSAQGNFLRLIPLRYERTFTDVTSLRQVLPALLQDLLHHGLPLQ